MGQQGWTPVQEPTGWTPVIEAPKTGPEQKTAPAQVRSRTGQLYTPPPEGSLKEFAQGAASNVDPRTYLGILEQAKDNPGELAKNIALSPVHLLGKLITQPARTAGELTGALALGEVPSFVRGRLITKAPTGAAHLDRSVPVRPSELTQEQLGERIASGTGTPPNVERNAMGRPQKQVLRTQPAPITVEDAAATAQPDMQPLGTPRILTKKATPASWTPEAARARLELNDWHSGAEPGSAEARSAQSMHRYDAETANRYQFMLRNQNGVGAIGLVANPTRMIPLAIGEFLARKAGLPPMVGGALGYGAPEIVRSGAHAIGSPTGNALIRSALLARLAAASGQDQGTAIGR